MNETLKILVFHEIKTDLKSKTFWIGTFVVPIVLLIFGGIAGVLMNDSESFMEFSHGMNAGPEPEEMTPLKVLGMLLGIFPVIFLMMYGSMIFNKVKSEKCNRVVEVLATCVDGKTMMASKIISVGVIGVFQLILWGICIALLLSFFVLLSGISIPLDVFANMDYWLAFIWAVLFFIGGYSFYGSLFVAAGAMTDKNNENQIYLTLLTFILLASFYIGEYAIDHASGAFITACCYIPFTSSTILTVVSAAQEIPVWQSLTGLLVLYMFSIFTIKLAGKIYTSSILLKGKTLTIRDISTFIKSK